MVVKTILAACVAFIVCTAGITRAQVRLRHPDQFYTNGKKIGGWTRDTANRLRSTFWFAKNPEDSLAYQQQIVIIYDADPTKAYYFDSTTKEFVGRFEMKSEQYSLLPKQFRRERLEAIDKSKFPPPGPMPTIGEMLERPGGGMPSNPKTMMTPPPTTEFPRLQASSWDTTYTTDGGRRVRAQVDFQGTRGTYLLVETKTEGILSDVQYAVRQDSFSITGRWSLQGRGGYFSFSIPKDNIDVFWGDWGLAVGRNDGTWDGIRRER
jgi:hypothetical protein